MRLVIAVTGGVVVLAALTRWRWLWVLAVLLWFGLLAMVPE
ncbi:hypothetical protein [Chromobacterium phragmitis]|nr:hypothetical protein [Chromobacterium phragmitis]